MDGAIAAFEEETWKQSVYVGHKVAIWLRKLLDGLFSKRLKYKIDRANLVQGFGTKLICGEFYNALIIK